jgi:hypothetical protein
MPERLVYRTRPTIRGGYAADFSCEWRKVMNSLWLGGKRCKLWKRTQSGHDLAFADHGVDFDTFERG